MDVSYIDSDRLNDGLILITDNISIIQFWEYLFRMYVLPPWSYINNKGCQLLIVKNGRSQDITDKIKSFTNELFLSDFLSSLMDEFKYTQDKLDLFDLHAQNVMI